tara:strand:- start:1390 stop:1689 length:300 start_codon:yes stop_codon:yes gene_type:complete
LSNKKKNNKNRKIKKQNKYSLERLQSGDIISYHDKLGALPRWTGPGTPRAPLGEMRYGIVIDVCNRKKKWLREYKILTEYSVWTLRPGHTMNYIILKVE